MVNKLETRIEDKVKELDHSNNYLQRGDAADFLYIKFESRGDYKTASLYLFESKMNFDSIGLNIIHLDTVAIQKLLQKGYKFEKIANEEVDRYFRSDEFKQVREDYANQLIKEIEE